MTITRNIAQLPSASADRKGLAIRVRDGASATDCTTGGGSTVVLCTCDGAAWVGTPVLPELTLAPGAGWANTSGTATLTQQSLDLHWWEFLDNNAVDRIEWTGPIPAEWAGRTLDEVDVTWATNGTSANVVVVQVVLSAYTPGTHLLTSAGASVYNSGTTSLTPGGTAYEEATKTFSASGTISADAKNLRLRLERRSDDASDTNAEGWLVTGVRVRVA